MYMQTLDSRIVYLRRALGQFGSPRLSNLYCLSV